MANLVDYVLDISHRLLEQDARKTVRDLQATLRRVLGLDSIEIDAEPALPLREFVRASFHVNVGAGRVVEEAADELPGSEALQRSAPLPAPAPAPQLDVRDTREARDTRDTRGAREGRDARENRDARETRDPRDAGNGGAARRTAPLSMNEVVKRFITEMGRLETRRDFMWVGFVRDTMIPNLGVHPSQAQRVLDALLQDNIVSLVKRDNPKSPEHPSTGVELNHENELVMELIAGENREGDRESSPEVRSPAARLPAVPVSRAAEVEDIPGF